MIAVFLAPGFEEIEALTAVDVLRRGGVDVQTVGVGGSQITGAHGITVTAYRDASACEPESFQGVVLPGGMPGATNLADSPLVTACVQACAARGGLVAAICAAPLVLGRLGLLKNRGATCYPGFEKELKGALVAKCRVCVDENIITANGPGAALAFALELVAYLKDRPTAEALRQGMQCGNQ